MLATLSVFRQWLPQRRFTHSFFVFALSGVIFVLFFSLVDVYTPKSVTEKPNCGVPFDLSGAEHTNGEGTQGTLCVASMKAFRDMTWDAVGFSLKTGSLVPGMQLEVVVWQNDPKVSPKPILMLKNSHIKFYDEALTEKIAMDFFLSVLHKSRAHLHAYVLDMGINDGYLSALAASYGYGVICADGQPECVRNFNFAVSLNGWERIEVHNKIVSSVEKTFEIPNGICGGASNYQAAEANIGGYHGAWSALNGTTTVSSITVDNMVGDRDVLYWHLDAEGSEMDILKSARKLISEKRLRYLSMEFIPSRFGVKSFEVLANYITNEGLANFDCVCTFEMIHSRPVLGGDWDTYLHTHPKRIDDWQTYILEEVKKERKHDILCAAKPGEHW